ncbi:MAG: OmpA family protein [Myxococcota bacterium]|nr:OmpA family protein [Myxococcota bacterium]
MRFRRLFLNSVLRPSLLLAGLALLSACPKQQQPDKTPEPPGPAVQIDSITPRSTTEGEAVTVTMSGHGFLEGSEVYLGAARARGVDVYSGSELTFRAAETLASGSYDVRIVTPGGDQGTAPVSFVVEPRPEETSDCSLQIVYFDFSESQLTSDTREALSNNAQCIQDQKLQSVRLEGHADERGSTLFNLSLGEERAESVRDYLVDLGADRAVFSIVSYGEERPAVRGFSEESWSKNRRVEFAIQ